MPNRPQIVWFHTSQNAARNQCRSLFGLWTFRVLELLWALLFGV
jgi:hypothetical protein